MCGFDDVSGTCGTCSVGGFEEKKKLLQVGGQGAQHKAHVILFAANEFGNAERKTIICGETFNGDAGSRTLAPIRENPNNRNSVNGRNRRFFNMKGDTGSCHATRDIPGDSQGKLSVAQVFKLRARE